jgi:HK97 family phage major capsid protein
MSVETIENTLAEVKEAVGTFVNKYKNRIENLEKFVEAREAAQMRANLPGGGGARTLAEHLHQSAEFKQFVANNCRGRVILHFDSKQVANLGYGTPGVLPTYRVPEVIKPPQPKMRVRDLLRRYEITTGALEYVKEDVFTNAAAPVSEASSKPESDLTFVPTSVHLVTLAHWLTISKQSLEDLSVLRSYVDARLIDGLLDTEDEQILLGSGSGTNINGLVTQATAVAGTYATTGDNYIDKIGNALTELEDDKYTPDAIVVNPADWRRMLKAKTNAGGANTGEYLLGGPASIAEPRLWGLPVVTCPKMPVGDFLVGQFSGSAALFAREPGITVEVSTEHSDFFIRNLVAIRAEERIALAVFRPGGFRYGSF